VLAGSDALATIAAAADIAVNGVVGFAGLPVTLAALQAGRRLALANKESLIAGGPVVQRARTTVGAEIVPVDSEHCAVHQCLRSLAYGNGRIGGGGPPDGRSDPAAPEAWPSVRRIVLTASGGPFRGRSLSELTAVTVEDALAHPTWRMGPKITVDSSTLMNKGLEVIEAHELFGIGYDRVDVVVHPQSIVHSMVEAIDGATIAQLSQPDMRLPIGYALAYPDRLDTPFGAMDWTALPPLNFELPDRRVFRCLDLAYAAGRLGGTTPACLNGANEVAVAAFLEGRIRWTAIAEIIEEVVARTEPADPAGVDDVLEADRWARAEAMIEVERRVRVA
jgi:1-deoxy-D-xylulose-5-phosphate reductoisomerase